MANQILQYGGTPQQHAFIIAPPPPQIAQASSLTIKVMKKNKNKQMWWQ